VCEHGPLADLSGLKASGMPSSPIAFPRLFGPYARDLGLLTLPQAIAPYV